MEFYEKQGRKYDVVVLLQPTSPFRETKSLKEAVALYTSDIDMVVSVKEAATNPYYNSFEEDAEGLLVISKGMVLLNGVRMHLRYGSLTVLFM